MGAKYFPGSSIFSSLNESPTFTNFILPNLSISTMSSILKLFPPSIEQPDIIPLSLHDGHAWQLPKYPPLVGMFLHFPATVLVLQLGFPNHIQTFFSASSYDQTITCPSFLNAFP